MTFKDRLGRAGEDSGAQSGMKQIAFDQDFTTFDETFPNAELGPSTGITLEQAKAGLTEDGGELLVDTAAMVTAGADADFDLVLYLTEPCQWFASVTFIMEMLGFDLPGVMAMVGIDHLESDVSTTPPASDISGATDGLAAVGLFGDHTGGGSRNNELVRWDYSDPPISSNMGLTFVMGQVCVEPQNLGTRMAHVLNNSIAGLDAGTTWTQLQLNKRGSPLSDTHVLRPCLVLKRDPDFADNNDLKINRLNLFYNVRA